jgi:hypothetical protein
MQHGITLNCCFRLQQKKELASKLVVLKETGLARQIKIWEDRAIQIQAAGLY